MRSLFAIIPKTAFTVLCVCSALYFLLAADVRFHGPISKLDRPISERFHAAGTAKSLFIQSSTDIAVSRRFLWAITALLVVIRRWHYLPVLWFAVDFGGTINGKMQAFFARDRPRFTDLEVLTHPGFPSGHAAGAALLFGFLIILSLRELRSRDLKCFSVSLAVACILFVGWTRMALLVHHPTDVLGSFLWATAWLVGCLYGNIAAYRWSAKYLYKWADPPWPATAPEPAISR